MTPKDVITTYMTRKFKIAEPVCSAIIDENLGAALIGAQRDSLADVTMGEIEQFAHDIIHLAILDLELKKEKASAREDD